MKLGKKMQAAGKDREEFFKLWMEKESDLIQDCGKAFGERLTAEVVLDVMNENPELEQILDPIYRLFCLNVIEQNAGLCDSYKNEKI